MLRRLLSLLGWQWVDDVAQELAAEFMRLVPVSRAGTEAAMSRAIDVVVGHAKGHRRKRNWGFVASNRCSNSVKWRLLDGGYPPDVAERVARALAVGMSHDR